MSDQHDPDASQRAVRDLYANSPDTTALIAKFRDQVADLSDHLKAYHALEQLVSSTGTDETAEGVTTLHADLGALLRVVNRQMQRQVDALAESARLMQIQAGKI